MGKRLLLIAFFTLVLASLASAAMTVTLDSPADANTSSSDTMDFTCSAAEDGNYTISELSLFTDISGSWAATDTAVVSGASVQETFTVNSIADGSYTWSCRAKNSNDEYKFATTNRTFTVSTAVNTAPSFTGTIPDKTFAEDASLSDTFDLDDYFSDTDALTYSSSGNSNVEVEISSGAVSFTAAANWSGTETITFTATDTGDLTNTSNSVLINVTAVNDAPYYSTIPDFNWSKNTNKTIDLDNYFDDVEGSSLTYNVSSMPDNITITFSGSSVTFAPNNGWAGSETVIFTANDSELTTESNSVELSVGSGNNTAPIIGCLGTGVAEITTEESKKLSVTTSDADDDSITIKWYVDNSEVEGSNSSYMFSKDTAGEYVVKAEASDGYDTSSCSWTITVTEGPEIVEINNNEEASGTSSLLDNTGEIAECGNDIIEDGEDCSSCPEDVRCAENEICSAGACVLEQPSNTAAIIIFFSIMFAIAIAGFVIYKMTSKKSQRQMFNEAVDLGKGQAREKPSVDVHDIYDREKPKQTEPSIPKRPKVIKETPLQKYIRNMKEKGFKSKEIVEKLRKQGWKDEDFKGFL